MNSEKLQQLKDEIQQEISEALKNSNFTKVLEAYGISGDNVLKFQCLLDSTKIEFRSADEEQQVKGSLRKIPSQDIVIFQCCMDELGNCIEC